MNQINFIVQTFAIFMGFFAIALDPALKTEPKESKESEEVVAVSRFLKLQSLKDAHPKTTQILNSRVEGIERFPFIITSSLTLADGRVFYFTNIFKSSDRDLVIMFAKNKSDLFVPRLLYKSKSSGGFRVSRETKYNHENTLSFCHGHFHYTQETMVALEIALHLERMSIKGQISRFKRLEDELQKMIKLFFLDVSVCGRSIVKDPLTKKKFHNTNIQKGVYSYMHEIELFPSKALEPFQAYPPGVSFRKVDTSRLDGDKLAEAERHNAPKAKDFYDILSTLKYPEGFLPDFSKGPKNVYTLIHSLLGETLVEVFIGKLDNRPVEWHFARDVKGRIWIDRLHFMDQPTNSYGILNLVINSGLLTNKPLEYKTQSELLWGEDKTAGLKQHEMILPFDGQGLAAKYVDICPLLNVLEPIRQFRKMRNIARNF